LVKDSPKRDVEGGSDDQELKDKIQYFEDLNKIKNRNKIIDEKMKENMNKKERK
jgi:hypothetical protein